MELTPVHVFTLVAEGGGERRIVIPGGYCDRRQPTFRPGEREDVGRRTWRSDLRYLDHYAGQRDYKG